MYKLLFSIISASMLITGCTKIEPEAASKNTKSSNESTEILEFSKKTLQFKNMEELHSTIIDISAMNGQQRQQWDLSNDGFTSMEAAGYMIVEQMKTIGNKDGILAMRSAYDDLFIFDPNTDEVRVAPLFKASKPGYQWICNAYGNVEIDNKIVNLNDITTFDQTWIGNGKKTRGVSILELLGNSRRLTVASSCNEWSGKSQAFLRYTSEVRQSGTWYPSGDTYTVSYAAGTTNNNCILEADTRFKYYLIPTYLNSFNSMTMSPYYQHDDFVGWLTQYYETGYNIASAQTQKSGTIYMYN